MRLRRDGYEVQSRCTGTLPRSASSPVPGYNDPAAGGLWRGGACLAAGFQLSRLEPVSCKMQAQPTTTSMAL